MAQQISDALASMSHILTLYGQDALRSSSRPAASQQDMEEPMLTLLDASIRQLEAFRTQARAQQEALKAQPCIRPQSPSRSDPVPSSGVDGTWPSMSPENSHYALVSAEVITGYVASKSRASAVVVTACSSTPGPSTSRHQSTEQHFPNQNHRHASSGMPNASTAAPRSNRQPPHSSVGARLRSNANVGVRTSNTGNSSSSGEERFIFWDDPEAQDYIDDAVDIRHATGGISRRPDTRTGARVTHNVDRVDESNIRDGRITEGVRAGSARPQQGRSVRPASSAAFPHGPRSRALGGVASGRGLIAGNRSRRSYTETNLEYKRVKPKKDPFLKRPLLVNGSVPTYV